MEDDLKNGRQLKKMTPNVFWKFWVQVKILSFRREFWVRVKILGSGENFRFGRKFWIGAKILGSGGNFGFGWKFWVQAKIFGLGEIFWFGLKFWVRVKILGSGENFGFGLKFWVRAKNLHFAFCILHFAFCNCILKFAPIFFPKKMWTPHATTRRHTDATPKTNGHPLRIHVRVWTDSLAVLLLLFCDPAK